MVLDNESLSSLSLRKVVDGNGKTIGRIKDAIVNKKDLIFRGFVIHGSKWEEMLEDINIKQDVDPLITPDLVVTINDSTIVLNKPENELPNAMAPGTLAENEMFLTDLRKIPLKDPSGKNIGILTDIFFEKDEKVAYQIDGKEFIIFLSQYFLSRDLNYVISPAKIKFMEDHYQLQETIRNIERELKLNMTNIVRDLMLEAISDGKISDDEKTLIDYMTVDLKIYYEALEKALEDSIITKEEIKTLDGIKEEILEKLRHVAKTDQQINAEERALIKKFAAHVVDRRKELFWKVYSSFYVDRQRKSTTKPGL
ncbi:MAG: PRC-barrel domain-containing protein [Candidatus Hodarchaeales archaeon]|jgi:sporulation protein YlmC with PRC-barrel domain